MPSLETLIERSSELATLSDALNAAGEGRGSIVLIAGEAGVGKTTLAEAGIGQSILASYRVRTQQVSSSIYAAPVTLFRLYLARHADGLAESAISTPPLNQLRLLLPELGDAPDKEHPDLLREAIIQGIGEMARREPLVVLLDDLQWADHATLELLPDLGERLRDWPICLVGTYRSNDLPRGHRLRWLRNELRRRRLLNEIALEPFTPAQSEQFIGRRLGAGVSRSLIERIHEKAQGLPLFIEEIVNELEDKAGGGEVDEKEDLPLPESLRDAVVQRVNTLSEASRNMLEVAAAAGIGFDPELVCPLAGDDACAFDDLIERALIVETDHGGFAFRHALVRDAVYSQLTWTRRRQLNRQIAQWLQAKGGRPEQVAWHWMEAGEGAKARESLLEAAEDACRLHAYWDAERWGSLALKHWPADEEPERRLEILERHAHCAQVSGQMLTAEKSLLEMAASPIVQADAARAGRLYRALATLYVMIGRQEAATAMREKAVRAFETAGLRGELAAETLTLGGEYLGALRLEEARQRVETAIEEAKAAGREDVQARAMGLMTHILSCQGEFEKASDYGQAGLALASKHQLADIVTEIYRHLARVPEYRSEYHEAGQTFQQVINRYRDLGMDSMARDCMTCMGYIQLRIGQWNKALEACREILKQGMTTPAGMVFARGLQAIIHSYRGEIRSARKHLRQTAQDAERWKLSLALILTPWINAMLSEQEGHREEAAQHYRVFLNQWLQSEDIHDAIIPLSMAATLFGEEGMERETARCIDGLASITHKTGNSEAIAAWRCSLGEAALLKGKAAEAREHFKKAAAMFESMRLPLELARAQARTGVSCLEADPKEASRQLNAAYRLARNLGARPLAGRINEALGRLGENPEERGGMGSASSQARGGLTRRQVEILPLLAQGLSNKEMAARLYLSPRTVEMHVAGILERLNCRSRSEAVGRAMEAGLLDGARMEATEAR